jgi:hypothetical protein
MDCIFTSKRNYQLMTRRESADDRRLPAQVSTYTWLAHGSAIAVNAADYSCFIYFSSDVAISVAQLLIPAYLSC